MRRHLTVRLVALVALTALAHRVDAAPRTSRYRDGELLVRFKDGVGPGGADRAHRAVQARVARGFSTVGHLELVKLPRGTRVEDAVRAYRRDPAVAYAEPNYTVRSTV